MNSVQLNDMVREALGGTATSVAASLSIEAVLRSIEDGLREDGSVKLAGFGSFRVKETPARSLRLPSDGRICNLPARPVLRFKAAPTQRYILHEEGLGL